jgi:hypothetical protein
MTGSLPTFWLTPVAIPFSLFKFRKDLIRGAEIKPRIRRKVSDEPPRVRDTVTDEILLPWRGMEDDLRDLALL